MDLPPPPIQESRSDDILPSPPGEVHESDVLNRKGRFSWKTFGGDGFLFSVVFHTLLAVLAIFLIVGSVGGSRKPEPEQNAFTTGAGGGRGGEIPSQAPATVSVAVAAKTLPRLMSTGASPTSLPDRPETPSALSSLLASEGIAGAASSGSGGGLGGGVGLGNGLGVGNGSGHVANFTSIFGKIGGAGLIGSFYDCKQTPDEKPSKYGLGESGIEVNNTYGDEVLEVFAGRSGTWDEGWLKRNFFKAPVSLAAGMIMIPHMSANSAPTAYQVQDKVKPMRWLALYKGTVIAPKSGKFRFMGAADDVLVVRWEEKPVLDCGLSILSGEKSNYNYGNWMNLLQKSIHGSREIKELGEGENARFVRTSQWFEVTRGKKYPLEILISEVPGGGFNAFLAMEERDPEKKTGDGHVFAFRLDKSDPPEGANRVHPAIDLTGKGLVWEIAPAASRTRPR